MKILIGLMVSAGLALFIAFFAGMLSVMLFPPAAQLAQSLACPAGAHVEIQSETCTDSEGTGTCYNAFCVSASGAVQADSNVRIYLAMLGVFFGPVFLLIVAARLLIDRSLGRSARASTVAAAGRR